VLAGVSHVFRSPYLLGIVAYMLLYTITATFLYFQQAEIVERVFEGRAARTGFFARIDLLVNVLTLGTQVFLTGRIIKLLGVGVTLALLPLLCMVGFTGLGLVGFAGLGLAPAVGVLVTFQVLRRAGNFSLARPARETLYTVVSREDKYKAKNFIDTFVYRGGDQIGAWSYAAMGWIGLTMTGIAFAAVPLAGVWLLVALWLGRKQTVIARANVPEGITR
jgi:AAA family ATP:ADP antiporter